MFNVHNDNDVLKSDPKQQMLHDDTLLNSRQNAMNRTLHIKIRGPVYTIVRFIKSGS